MIGPRIVSQRRAPSAILGIPSNFASLRSKVDHALASLSWYSARAWLVISGLTRVFWQASISVMARFIVKFEATMGSLSVPIFSTLAVAPERLRIPTRLAPIESAAITPKPAVSLPCSLMDDEPSTNQR